MKEALHQNKLASRMREHAGSRPALTLRVMKEKNPSLTLRVMKEALASRCRGGDLRTDVGNGIFVQ